MNRLLVNFQSAVRTQSVGALVMVLIIAVAHYLRTHQFGWPDVVAGVAAYAVVIIAFACFYFVRGIPDNAKQGQ